MQLPSGKVLREIYGEEASVRARFERLAGNFVRVYGDAQAEFFSAPGRTEIIGNHTDHNGGKVIAAAIDMDTIGAARPNGTRVIRITSEGYAKEIVVDLEQVRRARLSGSPAQLSGTTALVAGMAEGAEKYGFAVSGFDAYVSTEVIAAAGVSSSASFEMLVCAMFNTFFNEGKMTCTDYAKIGRYAENIYWNKASGMMDQMACAVGGTVLFNFSDREESVYESLDFSFRDCGCELVIVNTGKGHADLSREYSEVPKEMGEAAEKLGVSLLYETDLETLLAHCGEINNDRAVLRAIHFFEETRRVEEAAEAIGEKDFAKALRLMDESGNSSWELLQNCYSLQDCHEQKIPLTLALTNLFLRKIGGGICRVHGGGFAGVIMCVVPSEHCAEYVRFIGNYVGEENVYPMNIRQTGAVHMETE